MSFQAERAPSVQKSYPGTSVQVQYEGRERGGINKTHETLHSKEKHSRWNGKSQFIKTENCSLKLVNYKAESTNTYTDTVVSVSI